MRVRDGMQVIRTQWVAVVGALLATLLVTVVVSLVVTPLYESSSRVSVPNDRRVTLSEQVDDEDNLRKVVSTLNFPTTVDRVQAQISAKVDTDQRSVRISARDDDPTRAREIAAATARVFVESHSEMDAPTEVRVLDVANTPRSPVTPRILTNLAIAAVVGLILGFGLALLRNRRTTPVS